MSIELSLLVRQSSSHVFLIDALLISTDICPFVIRFYSQLLRDLVLEEGHAPACILHDHCSRESAQNARLVIFRASQCGKNRIVRIRELCIACWTNTYAGMQIW